MMMLSITIGVCFASCQSQLEYTIDTQYFAPKSMLVVTAQSSGTVDGGNDLGKGTVNALYKFEGGPQVETTLLKDKVISLMANGISMPIADTVNPSTSILPFLESQSSLGFDKKELLALDTLLHGLGAGPKATEVSSSRNGIQVNSVHIQYVRGSDTTVANYPLRSEN